MIISTSILTASFSSLKEELNSISKSILLHLDIMDGCFVPKLSFGSDITKQISQLNLFDLDIHLMTSNTRVQLEQFNIQSLNRCKYVTIHYEQENDDVFSLIDFIKSKNVKVGITFKPDTIISNSEGFLPEIKKMFSLVDLVLVMSVNPGLGGQALIPSMIDRAHQIYQYRKDNDLKFLIEVDGGIKEENISLLSFIDIAVIGSGVFNLSPSKRNSFLSKLQGK